MFLNLETNPVSIITISDGVPKFERQHCSVVFIFLLTLTPRSPPVFRTALKASPQLPPIPLEGGIPRGLSSSLHRPEGALALQSSLSLPSSLTQKCERGLLNGPDRRWRPQCAAAGEDDFAVAQGYKSTYCTHSTARGTGRRLGSQITENRGGKGERVRNGIPSKKGLIVFQLHKFHHAKPGIKMRRSYFRMQGVQIFGSPFHTFKPTPRNARCSPKRCRHDPGEALRRCLPSRWLLGCSGRACRERKV